MVELCWNVYRNNINSRKIEVFNIFDNYEFTEDCFKIYKEHNTYDEFREAIKNNLMHYFWCKCEYEVLIRDIFEIEKYIPERIKTEKKVDVYEQVMLNFDSFASKTYVDLMWLIDYLKYDVKENEVNYGKIQKETSSY